MATPAKDTKVANNAAAAKAAPAAVHDAGALAPNDPPASAEVDLYPAVATPAAVTGSADAPLDVPENVEMTRNGQTTWVRNNASVALMQTLGWQLA